MLKSTGIVNLSSSHYINLLIFSYVTVLYVLDLLLEFIFYFLDLSTESEASNIILYLWKLHIKF